MEYCRSAVKWQRIWQRSKGPRKKQTEVEDRNGLAKVLTARVEVLAWQYFCVFSFQSSSCSPTSNLTLGVLHQWNCEVPIELRVLARLEVKKRQLLAELAEVESQHRQLSREIELKEIPIPWLDTV
jgi:hypothetical protein